MKLWGVLAAAAAVTLAIAGPAVRPAQAQTPHVNLLSDTPSKTQEEKDADAARDKAYRDSLRKIPDSQAVSNDPWGSVRAAETPAEPAPKAKTKVGGAGTTRTN